MTEPGTRATPGRPARPSGRPSGASGGAPRTASVLAEHDPRPQLQQPSQVVGVPPDFGDQLVGDAEGERRGEPLALAPCRCPKNSSCRQQLVARTTTRSPSAMTSSTVHFCSTGPMCPNSARSPACPDGSPGGPPYIRQSRALSRHNVSTSPLLTRPSQPVASRLLRSGSVMREGRAYRGGGEPGELPVWVPDRDEHSVVEYL